MKAFLYIAILGLCVSIAVHVATLCGVDPQARFPFVWLLHVGIFVVFIPAITLANRANKGSAKRNSRADFLSGVPQWMRFLAGPLIAYTVFNFLFTTVFLLGRGSPTQRAGGYALTDHGRLVRMISEPEYHRYRAYEVRAFSGHWMLFYAVSAAMLLGATRHRRDADVN